MQVIAASQFILSDYSAMTFVLEDLNDPFSLKEPTRHIIMLMLLVS
jgi:hypothetical protein